MQHRTNKEILYNNSQNLLISLNSISKIVKSKISKEYDTILENISLNIYSGNLISIIGPNGAGKTTLAKIVLGIEKPTSGTITKFKKNLKIGYVPQKLHINPNLPITAEALVSMISPNFVNKYAEDTNILNIILNFVSFDSLKFKDIRKLSGGEFQKILIASVLLNDFDIIILDEPTKYLDINSQQEFYRLLNIIQTSKNITIFMVSHDIHTVLKQSTKIICLNKHICCRGVPNDIKHNNDFLKFISFFAHQHDHKH